MFLAGNNEYRRRHDGVATSMHWNLCDQNDLECGEKWFDPTAVSMENEAVKVI